MEHWHDLFLAAKGDVDGDGELPYFYTDGSKGMKLDADLSTAAHKAKRAQRFAEGGSRDRRDQPRSKPLNIMASINNQLLQGRFSGSWVAVRSILK